MINIFNVLLIGLAIWIWGFIGGYLFVKMNSKKDGGKE